MLACPWQAQDELNSAAELFRRQGIAVVTVVAAGHVVEMIVDEAAQRQASLTLMATHSAAANLRRRA
jgi:nucleotide-binding universal stress UspA family protein